MAGSRLECVPESAFGGLETRKRPGIVLALRLLLSVARLPRSSEDRRWEVRGWLADLEAECDGCWTVAAGQPEEASFVT